MKNINHILALIFLVAPIFCFAQDVVDVEKEDKKPKHEIRIISENFFSEKTIVDPNNIVYSNYPNLGLETYRTYADMFNYGLGYNLNLKKIGFRTRFYYNASSEIFLDPRSVQVERGHKQYRFALGLNYQLQLKKIVMFSGVDVSVFQINVNQISSSYIQSAYFFNNGINLNYSGYGIEPLVGVKYFISENFSISSELRVIFDKIKGETTNDYQTNQPGAFYYNDKINFDGFDNRIGPNGSVSLNIHF